MNYCRIKDELQERIIKVINTNFKLIISTSI